MTQYFDAFMDLLVRNMPKLVVEQMQHAIKKDRLKTEYQILGATEWESELLIELAEIKAKKISEESVEITIMQAFDQVATGEIRAALMRGESVMAFLDKNI